MDIVGCPLIEDKDDQVAKQGGHEDYFRDEAKVDIQGLLEIAKKEKRKWYEGLAGRWHSFTDTSA